MGTQHAHQTANEPLPVPDIATTPPPTTPFFPPNPSNLTQADVERIVDSRIHIAYAQARQKERDQEKRANTVKMVAIGVGTFAVCTATQLTISAIRRRRAAAAGK